jgi:hypothetical protein
MCVRLYFPIEISRRLSFSWLKEEEEKVMAEDAHPSANESENLPAV